jgi:hypothetical protein
MKTYANLCRSYTRNFLVIPVFFVALFAGNVSLASDAIAVTLGSNSITADVTVADVTYLKLRVAGPGDFLAEEKTDTGNLSWSARTSMADGEYRYEVFATTGSQTPEHDDARLYREHGRFEVQGGVFVAPQDALPPGATNSTSQEQSFLGRLALQALEWMIPAASGAPIPITGGPLLLLGDISTGGPRIYFRDEDDLSSLNEWIIAGGVTEFQLFDPVDGSRHLWIHTGATTTGMRQLSNNDLSLAGDQVYIDYSRNFGGVPGPAVGIGTTTPIEALDIVHPFPAIRISDGATGVWLLEEIFDDFRIKNEISGKTSISIDSVTGNVGIGASNPDPDNVALDVTGSMKASFSGTNFGGDGLSKVMQMSAFNNAAGKSSDVGFELFNEAANFSWAFRTFQGAQGFVATKLETGGPEFTIENTTSNFANVVLRLGSGARNVNGQWINASSRAYKDNIQELSAADAIKALDEITPVTYTFKNDEGRDLNVGFIAEDTPELISTPDRKGLNPLEVVAMLTKVVKEQQKAMAGYEQALAKQQQLLDTLLEERAAERDADVITTSMLVK